jgi:tetratricopeptide (TPR) repeat protein
LALRPDFSTLPLHDQVELVLAAWREPIPRLLVFDNCEDEALLARWRPTSGGCVVLVTSRRMSWEPTLGVQQVPLGVLERDESVTLLQGYFGGSTVQPGELDALAEELGDLPLALHLAGSYLARYRESLTPTTYLAQLRKSAALDHPSLQGEVFSPTGHVQHVQRTFSLSVERLDPSEPTDCLARALLARAALFAPGELIPRDLLLATVVEDEQNAEDALVRLMTLGLVEAVEHGGLRLHRLVVQFVLGVMRDEQALADVEQAVLNTAERLAEEAVISALIPLQAQLRFVAERALERGEPAGALATILGHHLWLLSESQAARTYLEHALALREQAVNPDPLLIAATLNILGLVVVGYGDLNMALEHARRALIIWETHLGQEHPTTDAEVNNIAYAHTLRGDYKKAEIAFRRSLATRHRIFGLCHRETARVLNNLGMLNVKRGAYRTARRYLRLALAIREQLVTAPHMSIAMTLTHLGEINLGLDDYACALAYHGRALAMRQAMFGEVHISVAESLTNLGRVMRADGKISEAWDYQLRALAMHETLGSTAGYDAAYTLDELGVLSSIAREHAKAQTYLEQALAIWERLGGVQHPERAAPLLHLGQVLYARGDTVAAKQCLEQALRLGQEHFVAQHPLIAETRKALENCV